ncbi:uncharacterized protein LACBIDRAFT_295306 [Laccaria bicolor S238N-H82]|uniref:Predicted protein n=1 Tax=Laccaria bicolor (strain S238N-H82 / ATCC MYA-4686) TaxID=486041 RepID=B0DQA7_LACBS|nr:uncharacterized protein LACBIDRAFT_295306 [Laccaria bicolor S238N-H82]EDR03261.1 predicted protein [Laccaria bicolor S238N-H82]|eukprot:XP_001886057.1 predicted protein [Laccaria bicolor S238N-H82]
MTVQIPIHHISGSDPVSEPTEHSVRVHGLHENYERSTTKKFKVTSGLDPSPEPPLIQRLPAEILTEIFTYCVCDVTRPPPKEVDSILREPWTVSQTCQYWRNIVLSFPKLWSYIHLDLSEIQEKDVILKTNFPEMLALWMSRSGFKTPLHITFHDFAVPTDDIRLRSISRNLMSTLVSRSNRWAEVSLCVSPSIVHCLRQVKANIPLLHSFTLKSTDPLAGSPTVKEARLYKLLVSAPALRNLTLDFSRSFVLDKLQPPYAQLQSVSARTLTPHVLLSKTRSIKSASIRAVMFSGFLYSMCTVAICPELTSLELFVSPILLDFLELPALQHLSIQYTTEPDDFARITSLINRSSCFIRTLKLSQVTLPRKQVAIELFECLPSLVDLEVSIDKGRSETFHGFVNAMVIKPSTNPTLESDKKENEVQSNLLTHLERIKFECPRRGAYSSNDVKQLVDMVESRWRLHVELDNDVVQLKTIHLAAPALRQERLELMREEGLEVIGDFY